MELSISENAWWGTSIDRVQGIHVAKKCGYDEYCVFTTDLTPQLIKMYVRNGITVMPTFRKTEISDADLDAIAAYLTRNNKP